MLWGNRQQRIAVFIPTSFVFVAAALTVLVLYVVLKDPSGRSQLLPLLGLGFLPLLKLCVLVVKGDELRIWRLFEQASLPASACGFTAELRRDSRTPIYEVKAVGAGRQVRIALLYTQFGTTRFVRRLEAILLHGRDESALPPVLLAELEARQREWAAMRAATRRNLQLLLLLLLLPLTLLLVSLLGHLGR